MKETELSELERELREARARGSALEARREFRTTRIERIEERHRRGEGGLVIARAIADATDAIVLDAYREAAGEASDPAPPHALVALGGVRPPGDVPLFRRRPAVPVRQGEGQERRADLRGAPSPVGRRFRHRPRQPHDHRVGAHDPRRHGVLHRDAGRALPRRGARAVRQVPEAAVRRSAEEDGEQARGAAALPRGRVRPGAGARAERQGGRRRSCARSTCSSGP